MSTKNKRRADHALMDAQGLASRLAPYADTWIIAGSLRRGQTQVGDVDHVVVPKTASQGAGLFGQQGEQANLLWRELDAITRTPMDTTSINGKPIHRGPRWGEKHRTIMLGGFQHEFWTATRDTMGIQLLIRTGPADFSRRLVTRLRDVGYPARDGAVWDGTGPSARPIPTRTEVEVFNLANWPYINPEDRR